MLKMSCQKLSRQYLHLVVNEGGGLYSLRNMDVSKLFYPSTAEAMDAQAQAKTKKKNGINTFGSIRSSLPRPSVYYQPFLKVEQCPFSSTGPLTLLGGGSKNKIFWSDNTGHTGIYNNDMQSLIAMPNLHSPKAPDSVAISIPRAAMSDGHTDYNNNLFLLDMHPDNYCSFEVLTYDDDSTEDWCWNALPPPPFLDDQDYKAPLLKADFTVVDGTKICVSTKKATYSFDTVTHEWNKVGDWVLPFRAEYVPELGVWLGLSKKSGPYDLCTLDNFSTAAGSPPPTMEHVGEETELPERWSEYQLAPQLVNLGSGRFCIVNSFILNYGRDEYKYPWIPLRVFTGVEVLPPSDSDSSIRMVKHKSKSIEDELKAVL